MDLLDDIHFHESRTGIVQVPAGTQEYVLLICYQSLLVRLRGVEQECLPGSTILWTPGEPQYYGRPRTTWECTQIVCPSHSEFREHLDTLGIPCNRLLHCQSPSETDDILRCLDREFHRKHPNSDLIRHLFLSSLLVLHRSLTQHAAASSTTTVLQEIKAYLDQHYPKPISLADLAGQYHLSPALFSSLFKREFGIPAIKYLTKLRMEASRRFLQETSATITEIAHQVGYPNEFYFTRQFRYYYAETPSALRARCGHEREGPIRRYTRTTRRWDGWRTVSDLDFRAGADLDPRWQPFLYADGYEGEVMQAAPEYLYLQDGQLRLLPTTFWLNLRWTETLSEECLVELTLNNTKVDEGVNLAIALSGDLREGYRLRLYMDSVSLERIADNHWEVLTRSPRQLDPASPTYQIAFWRIHDEFFVEINGERHFTYYDPFAPQGPRHNTVAIGRFGVSGDSLITALRVLVRQHINAPDALEPGRILFQKGYLPEARQWFTNAVRDVPDQRLQQEAEYYITLTLPEHSEERTTVLQRIGNDISHAFRTRAMRALTVRYLNQRQFSTAVDMAILLVSLAPDEDISHEVTSKLVEELRRCPLEEQPAILALIARLPITQLELIDLPISSLASLCNMRLHEFRCTGTAVTDFSPISRLPLEKVSIYNNHFSDLSPLRGLHLQSLACGENELVDLSPLYGMSLHELSCHSNLITDLSPLHDMPLQQLICDDNIIADLTPLSETPLHYLSCVRNHISDISPLHRMSLGTLDCSGNHVRDLSPLQGMPLTQLRISCNQVHDLSPLRGMPLTDLQCGNNPITNITPLSDLPLTRLYIDGIPLEKESLEVVAALPLRHLWCDPTPEMLEVIRQHETMQSVNGHHRNHAQAVWPPLTSLLNNFRQGGTSPDNAYLASLRALAVPINDCAYLSLPSQMTFPEALAFTQWLGGVLPCPSTPEQYHGLQRYVAGVTMRFEYLLFLLGLQFDVEGRHRWANGKPATWSYLGTPPALIDENSYAIFIADETESVPWDVWNDQTWKYVIIEWPTVSSPVRTKSEHPRRHQYKMSLPFAVAFLHDILTAHTALPVTDLMQRAQEEGIAERTLRRAKKHLSIEAFRTGFGNKGEWYWRLPAANPHIGSQ